MSKPKLAVAQMTSTGDLEANFAACERLAHSAVAAGVSLLCLPECCTFLGARDTDALAVAEPLDGPLLARFGALCRETGLWLSLGGIPEASTQPGKRYNTHVLLDSAGEVTASYRKASSQVLASLSRLTPRQVHRFDIDIPGKVTLQESNVTLAGEALCAADSPVGRLGLSVCYDLRFPTLYQRLAFGAGATVLLVPAAFTRPTGEAHWETLLRARAIETQCYVAAAAQAGEHSATRASHGHAVIVDPWGTVIARCATPHGEGIAVAEVDAEWLATVRQRLPVAAHRAALDGWQE